MSIVVPAVLPSSRKDLEEKLALFTSIPTVSRIQIDVIDGRFAEPASWPYAVPHEHQEMLPYLDRFSYEIDLMCADAEQAAHTWLALGATRLTFHAESTTDLSKLLTSARQRYGIGAGFAPGLLTFGVALNVASDLALLEPCIGEIEYVQFMGIARIGVQGQPFDERVLEKVRIFHDKHPEVAIQVDGGVSLGNAKKLVSLGVSTLIVGSALLKSNDIAADVAKFEALQSPYGV